MPNASGAHRTTFLPNAILAPSALSLVAVIAVQSAVGGPSLSARVDGRPCSPGAREFSCRSGFTFCVRGETGIDEESAAASLCQRADRGDVSVTAASCPQAPALP